MRVRARHAAQLQGSTDSVGLRTSILNLGCIAASAVTFRAGCRTIRPSLLPLLAAVNFPRLCMILSQGMWAARPMQRCEPVKEAILVLAATVAGKASHRWL
eukprot:SAG11_NODE_2837_length_2920_cov_2.907834_1_plen_101_part_00